MKKRITLFAFLTLFATLTISSCSIFDDFVRPTGNTTSTTSTNTHPTTSTHSTSSTSSGDRDGFDYLGTGRKILDDALSEEAMSDIGVGIPSTGNRKALVIPVAFKTYTSRRGKSYGGFKSADFNKIEPAFNGTSEETGFQSVKSFYQVSSNGLLNIDFDVTDVINLRGNFMDYQNVDDDAGTRDIVNEALEALDSSIDFSQYDTNNDGRIDGIYIVYSVPYGGSPNENGISSTPGYNEDFWWAWVDWMLDDSVTVDGVKANYFMWGSVDFLNDAYIQDSSSYINVNALTFIHETGHMLGLDDYYDYDYDYDYSFRGGLQVTGFIGGVGGADIMDATVGDQTPISKILLGWETPTVVTESGTYNLVSLQDEAGEGQHHILLIPKDWNDSYFSEYYLVDFYTPTGLNALHKGHNGLFSEEGIRIYHIDATVSSREGKQFDSKYWTFFSYNNSTTDHLFIKLMEGDGDNSLEKLERYHLSTYYPADASNSDLFHAGQNFASTNTWYDGSEIGYTISVDSIADGVATIAITK